MTAWCEHGSPLENCADCLIEHLTRERDEARALLREVANSVELDDPRIGYVVVQIDSETWNDVRALEGR
jgi:hypothetical protein